MNQVIIKMEALQVSIEMTQVNVDVIQSEAKCCKGEGVQRILVKFSDIEALSKQKKRCFFCQNALIFPLN